ncbi:hypothetical protein BDV23DRAFT_170520 [Aspergillus alliaceus]|uniref:Alpha-acetolactate decarboxylase n=1 Tax=Petromyces alliaceus TaxID=209559 RepID=A0A5N7CGD6_PETAA|nr:hypothetical protein BDV23DRAFT_170520 [Aspergillus alliaceus]
MSPSSSFNYSILSALRQGLAQIGPTIRQILPHGDHGLGTASHLNGEMIIVDGEAYHFNSDNQLHKLENLSSLTMPTLHTALSPLLPSKRNCLLSLRLDGVPQMFGGLLFGFRSLGFSNGFSVAGFHLHFLSDDCNAGGHVTRLEAWDVKLSAAVIKEYRVMIHQEESHEVPIGDRAIKVNTRAAEG